MSHETEFFFKMVPAALFGTFFDQWQIVPSKDSFL